MGIGSMIGGMGKTLFIISLILQCLYIIPLLRLKIRKGVKKGNRKIEKLRTKPFKSIKEQKDFLNLKFPKSKFKWKWNIIPGMVWGMAKFIGLFLGWAYLLKNVNMSLLVGIGLSIALPWVVNSILRRFNLNNPGVGDILLVPLKKKGDKKVGEKK